MESHGVMVARTFGLASVLALCLMFWHVSYEEHTCAFSGFIST